LNLRKLFEGLLNGQSPFSIFGQQIEGTIQVELRILESSSFLIVDSEVVVGLSQIAELSVGFPQIIGAG